MYTILEGQRFTRCTKRTLCPHLDYLLIAKFPRSFGTPRVPRTMTTAVSILLYAITPCKIMRMII